MIVGFGLLTISERIVLVRLLLVSSWSGNVVFVHSDDENVPVLCITL